MVVVVVVDSLVEFVSFHPVLNVEGGGRRRIAMEIVLGVQCSCDCKCCLEGCESGSHAEGD